MRVWIDADAAPIEAKEVIFRAARRLKIEVIMVANQSLPLPPNASTVRSVAVRHGANEADRYIERESAAGDIVITADIPLAAALVQRNVRVIDPRGDEYTADNISSRLSMRNFLDGMRGAGTVTAGSRPYDARDKKTFAAAFDRALAKASPSKSPQDG